MYNKKETTMNHKTIISTLFLSCACHCCFGAIGCMEKSWHLKKAYDYKSFHYVTNTVDPNNPKAGYCQCPCDKYIAQYGKSAPGGRCPVCRHCRVPQPVIIVNNALEQYKKYRKINSANIDAKKDNKNRKLK